MKNWFLPLAVLGISGLGLACASERGRKKISAVFQRLGESNDPLGEVNRFVDQQLNAIQDSLDRLAEALEEQQA